jgi:serine protease Do
MRTIVLVLLGTAGVVSSVTGQTPNPAPKIMKVASSGSSYIGVMVQEIDSERSKELKLHEEAGVEVTRVEPDSPADRAGMKVGDTIVQYNGQRVEGMEQFSRLVHETPAGREVKLDIVRGGAPQALMAKIGMRRPTPFAAMPAPMERFEFQMPDIPRSLMSWRSSVLGIECESLDGQLAQYFGVKEGVLVRSVTKGSAADKAGIKAGDVITRIDDAKVAAPSDISSRIRSLRGKSAPMVLMREHKEMTLSVAVDDDDRANWRWPQDPVPFANRPVQ